MKYPEELWISNPKEAGEWGDPYFDGWMVWQKI
jgi:hypothetical protein